MKTFSLQLILLLSSILLTKATLPSVFEETRLAKDIDSISYIIEVPGQEHILIIQTTGIIRIFKDGALLDTPVLDISSKVDIYEDHGLLGVAFHPDFATNGYFFAYYYLAGYNHARVSRFTMTNYVADPASETIIVDLESSPLREYKSGHIFVQDNSLIVLTGDGGVPDNSWRMDSLFGKALRYNFDGTIPTDNPFYDTNVGIYKAIYAYGIRNPHSGAFHPLDKKVFFGDVGLNYEELNMLHPGRNYGWPIVEGKIRDDMIPPDNYEDPIVTYKHENGYCLITGGSFYTPLIFNFPIEYVSRYFFGDMCAGVIRTIDMMTYEVQDFATDLFLPISFITSSNGNFYYANRGNFRDGRPNFKMGELIKVTSQGSQRPTLSFDPESVTVVEGSTVSFSTAADGSQPFTYEWKIDGAKAGENKLVLILNSVSIAHSGKKIKVTVTNEFGSVTSSEATLTVVQDLRLTATITAPADGNSYTQGNVITFAGKGFDNNTPQFAASALSWEVLFHHADHIHPIKKASGVPSGTVTLNFPEGSSDVFYEIKLTVKDSRGIVDTKSVKLYPVIVTYQIVTDPPGLLVQVDGMTYSTPVKISSTAGLSRIINAFTQTHQTGMYEFFKWSDGGAQSHAFTVPSSGSTTITASFIPRTLVSGGLKYYYMNGDYTAEPTFTAASLQASSILGFDIRLRTTDSFSMKWEGYLNILDEGTYTFYLTGNGGFKLNIHGKTLIRKVEVNGAVVEKSFTTDLPLGPHYIEVIYYFSQSASGLDPVFYLTYSYGSIIKQSIPFNILYQSDPSPCIVQKITQMSVPLPEVVDVESSDGTFVLAYNSSSGLPLNFSISGPGTLEFINDFARRLSLSGGNGNVTVTYWQHGNSLYCPALTRSYTITVNNPYSDTPNNGWIAAVVIGTILVFLVGYFTYRAWKKHQKNMKQGEMSSDTKRRIAQGKGLGELKGESISMAESPFTISSPMGLLHARKDSVSIGSINILSSEMSERA